MGVVKGVLKKEQKRNNNSRLESGPVKRSKQELDLLDIVLESDNKFKPDKTYRGVTNYLEKYPYNNDGREQARLKVTLQDSSGSKKSFYKYFDIDVSYDSKFAKFLRNMDAVDRNNRIIPDNLKNISVEATLYETKSGSLYIDNINPLFEEEEDNNLDEVEEEDFDDDTYTYED